MLISIITVNYNNLKGLQRTMASVLEQTYSPIEYIVIDGGSSDGSKDFIIKQESRLAYWISEPDTGIFHAMNKGIEAANGDYLLFLNSGDTFYNEQALSYFQPFLYNNPKLDLFYGNIMVVSNTQWIKTYPETLSLTYFIKDTLPHPATLIRRECFDVLMYDETLQIASDWKFFMLGICKYKFSYQYLDQVIATFHLDGISSKSPELVKQEREHVLHEEYFWRMQMDKFWNKVKTKITKTKF